MLSTTISSLEQDLIRDEGKRPKPYRDSEGHLTIGVGHNLDVSGLCDEAILAQLRYDLAVVEQALDHWVPWWRDQPEPVQRVLTNIAFNIGAQGLSTFTTFLSLVAARRYPLAASDLLSTKYAHQVGARAQRLATLLRSVV